MDNNDNALFLTRKIIIYLTINVMMESSFPFLRILVIELSLNSCVVCWSIHRGRLTSVVHKRVSLSDSTMQASSIYRAKLDYHNWIEQGHVIFRQRIVSSANPISTIQLCLCCLLAAGMELGVIPSQARVIHRLHKPL